jgi:hypothetical protein
MSLKYIDTLGCNSTAAAATTPGMTLSGTNLTDGDDNGSYPKSSDQMNCRFNVASNLGHNTNE